MFPTVIYEYSADMDAKISPCVMTLGFFDGVHIAHRDLINKGREIADEMGISLGVFTFSSESSLKPGAKRLYSTEEKMGLLENLGVDFAVVADFASVSSLSAEDFVKKALIQQTNCKIAVVGFNFRFGRGASGNADTLCRLMAENGGECVVRREMKLDGETVCTTLIRSCLEKGDIEKANRLLGAPYRISSSAIHGRGVGRKLGFPTVNTAIEARRADLKLGVYRTAVKADGIIYNALTNIGICPTFDRREIHAETYILDFSGDLYGKTVDIYLLDFMREEKQFKSEKELIMQINVDKEQAIEKNGEIKWQELGLK